MPYKNPEKQKAAQQSHYAMNKQRYLENMRRWRSENPEKWAECKRAERKRKQLARNAGTRLRLMERDVLAVRRLIKQVETMINGRDD